METTIEKTTEDWMAEIGKLNEETARIDALIIKVEGILDQLSKPGVGVPEGTWNKSEAVPAFHMTIKVDSVTSSFVLNTSQLIHLMQLLRHDYGVERDTVLSYATKLIKSQK